MSNEMEIFNKEYEEHYLRMYDIERSYWQEVQEQEYNALLKSDYWKEQEKLYWEDYEKYLGKEEGKI